MYFLEALPAAEVEELEIHLAECDVCTFRARREYALSGASGNWSATVHGSSRTRDIVCKSLLAAAGEMAEELRERVVSWARSHAGVVNDAVRVAVHAVTNQAEDGVRASSFVLHGGVAFEPRRVLGRRAPLAVLGGDVVPVTSFHQEGETLVLRFAQLRKEDAAPLAFLISGIPPYSAERLAPQWNDAHQMWTARIDNVATNMIIVVLPGSGKVPGSPI
jgi:hypothetical protein